jgi:hypothetical protein
VKAMACASLFLLVAVCSVGAQQPQLAASPLTVKGYKLHLQEREGKCVVMYEQQKRSGEQVLDLPAPCQFVRHPKNRHTAQSYTYKDLRNATVLLVVGGPLNAKRTDALMPDGCGTQWQAVILRRGSVSVSKISQGSTLCPSAGTDEKMFWVAAH